MKKNGYEECKNRIKGALQKGQSEGRPFKYFGEESFLEGLSDLSEQQRDSLLRQALLPPLTEYFLENQAIVVGGTLFRFYLIDAIVMDRLYSEKQRKREIKTKTSGWRGLNLLEKGLLFLDMYVLPLSLRPLFTQSWMVEGEVSEYSRVEKYL